jgi:glutamine amidotransferase PdxT
VKVGVLALQGAFREHQKAFQSCGVETEQIRKPEQLANISALVIPGGESTTIGKPHLKGGFALRCFQRLSRPDIITQRYRWHDNWYTSGLSIPVLSY